MQKKLPLGLRSSVSSFHHQHQQDRKKSSCQPWGAQDNNASILIDMFASHVETCNRTHPFFLTSFPLKRRLFADAFGRTAGISEDWQCRLCRICAFTKKHCRTRPDRPRESKRRLSLASRPIWSSLPSHPHAKGFKVTADPRARPFRISTRQWRHICNFGFHCKQVAFPQARLC